MLQPPALYLSFDLQGHECEGDCARLYVRGYRVAGSRSGLYIGHIGCLLVSRRMLSGGLGEWLRRNNIGD